MAPMDKVLSRTSSQGSIYQNESVGLQAGRSSTNLHAQAAAASIREAERSSSPAPSRSTSTPNLLRKANSRATSKTRSSDLLRSTAPSPSLLSPHRSATHTPIFSSPLNLITSTSSDSSRPSTGRTRRQSAADGSALAQGQSVDSGKSVSSPYGHSRAATLKPPEMSQRDVTGPLTRQATPQTVRDLGQDYTRYFNPFADSRSSSFADLHKGLPSYKSSSNLVSASAATNRLSNPFEPRDKRELNPFATASSSTTNLVDDSDPEKTFSPYLDDRLAAPSSDARYPLYIDEKEWDDDMHMPMFDDDVKLKAKWRDHFTRDNVVSTFGLAFMIIGLLFVFVVLPVMSYT
ncbi:beta-glucan synthesis-associated protein, partial [Cryomyces antarcticus]